MNFKKAYISHILVYNWLVRAPAHQELFLYMEVFIGSIFNGLMFPN
jgi:hypothetical protein